MVAKSAFGKNNFDRMEAAGLVAGADDESNQKERLLARARELKILSQKFDTVFLKMSETLVMSKPQQLKRITTLLTKVKELHATKLPVGAKKHVAVCINELTSIREGVFARNTMADKKMLTLFAAKKAQEELLAMSVATEARVERLVADSSSSSSMESFIKNAAEVIEKHSDKAELLRVIKTKSFVLERMPVVPGDNKLSAERMASVGFDVESLGGYPVLQNQLVIGINPRSVLGEHSGAVKGEKAARLIRERADQIRKMAEKRTKQRLQFVSDKAYSPPGIPGTWFWLMTDADIKRFARISPGNRVNVVRWGFAFN